MSKPIGQREDKPTGDGGETRAAADPLHSSQAAEPLEVVADADPPFLFHALIMACLITMVLLFRYAYEFYALISQEDHIVEWATVVFYLPAAFLYMRHGLRRRRPFDFLVGLFCFFVAGEEFSWGQRLLGLKPPKLFLEENVQQELTLHNFFGPSAHDVVFLSALLGYVVLLPLLSRRGRFRPMLESIGATPPPARFAPWGLFLSLLYVLYPMHLSSEWIETIVAALFLSGGWLLVSKRLTQRAIIVGVALAVAASAALTEVSNAQARKGNPERVECARVEALNLLSDIIEGGAAKEKLRSVQDSLHRRVWIAEGRDYLDGDRLQRFTATQCAGVAAQGIETRHRFATDPWGLSYWLYTERLADGRQQLTVYSFGPNRRRDSSEGAPGSDGSEGNDDIAATGILPPTAGETQP